MINFNLEKALAGEKVVTSDGKEATQFVLFTGISHNTTVLYCVIEGSISSYLASGSYYENTAHSRDLFMAPVTHTRWLNIYTNESSYCTYETKESADRSASLARIACVKITYTEGEGL